MRGSQIRASKRRDGSGVVLTQSGKFMLMTWQEWRDIRDQIDAIHAGQPPKKRYRMI
jgi:hypothetical protein